MSELTDISSLNYSDIDDFVSNDDLHNIDSEVKIYAEMAMNDYESNSQRRTIDEQSVNDYQCPSKNGLLISFKNNSAKKRMKKS